MTERPYTDSDLRAEAARQHAELTEDPDYMGVGEAMEDRYVQSTAPEQQGVERTGSTWAELLPVEPDDGAAYDEARRAIHDLIRKAADVSEWAINLGADGLEPEEHSITVNGDGRPIARLHFAFVPGMPDEMRTALVEGIGESIADAL